MPASIDAQSYYQASAHPFPPQSQLNGDVTADICVVGAGFTGLSAALELAQAGFKVVVLEARQVGYGASGRNGGQICTGFSPGQQRIEAQLGKEDALRFIRGISGTRRADSTAAVDDPDPLPPMTPDEIHSRIMDMHEPDNQASLL